MALKEDYKDAVFAGLRKYKMLDNGDGTVSPVDMTEYEAAGDKFGAKDVNAITKMVNCTGDAFDPGRDYEVGDYTIYDNTVWKFTTAHPAGEWDESHVEKTRILVEIAEQNKNFAELNEKLLSTRTLKLGKNTTVAANALIDLTFTSTDKCIGQSGYNLNDRNLAGKIEITGIEPDGNRIRLFGRNISSSAVTIPAEAHVIAFVVGNSSE